jgi:hypothetical protein
MALVCLISLGVSQKQQSSEISSRLLKAGKGPAKAEAHNIRSRIISRVVFSLGDGVMRRTLLCVVGLIAVSSSNAHAETAGRVIYAEPTHRSPAAILKDDAPPLTILKNAVEPPLVVEKKIEPLAGFHYGLGVGFNSSLGGIGEVKKEPGTNIVRVSRENLSAARGAFEVHYYIPTKALPFLPNFHDPKGFYTAIGPYVSLNTVPLGEGKSAGQLFDSIGLGLMFGIQGGGCDNKTAFIECQNEEHSFNIGIGAIIDTDVRRLRTGVVENMPTALPEADLLSKSTRVGLQVLFSYKLFSFNLK